MSKIPKIKDLTSLLNFLKTTRSFEQVLSKINIISIGDGKCTAELEIQEEHTNPMGGLHGGLSATLIDSISSYGLSSKSPGIYSRHVSVDIHISYLKGAKVGDKILIESNTIKSGKTLAFLEVLIKNRETGDLLVKGSHTKYILQK